MGCKTGGKTLGGGSAGTVIKPKTPAQINEESEQFRQAKQQPSTPVKSKPVKSKPVEVKSKNIEPKHLPPPPIKHEPLKPLNPVLDPPIVKVPPATIISPKSIKLEEKVNVKPIGEHPENNEEKVENSDGGGIIEKEKIKKMNWSDLLIFYILAINTLWLVYGLWGRYISFHLNSWINKLKNWYSNDEVAAKKPAAKKRVRKTAKKIQKKKIANKGERKSNLAAKKKPKGKKKS